MAEFTQEALTVLEARYLKRDNNGKVIETPDQLIQRVVDAVLKGETNDLTHWEAEFVNLMSSLCFVPNSPTLMNAGRDLGQLSACFVLPIEDDISAIFEAVKQSALIHKSGGGTGFSFSRLRPKGSVVKSTNGVASGPVSFMKVFNTTTEVIKQGGTRRGANLGVLLDSHPDILEWIQCKRDRTSFNNFNISVAITDEFMKAVKTGGSFVLRDPSKKKASTTIDARETFNLLCECAWDTGEPGIIFIDTINRQNPTPWLGKIESTNPCVSGDTLILTDLGYVPIKDVVDLEVNVWNGESFQPVTPKETGEKETMIDLEFLDGTKLSCTMYHGFYLKEGKRVEARTLKIGDVLETCDFPVIQGMAYRCDDCDTYHSGVDVDEKIAYTSGFYSGDGTKERDSITLYGAKKDLLQYMFYEQSTEAANGSLIVKLPTYRVNWYKEFVPSVKYSVQARLDWLAGLIDSDGTLNSKNGNVAISSVDRGFLYNVKLLLNTLGATGSLSFHRPGGLMKMPDGKGGKKDYMCQPAYRLLISLYSLKKLSDLGLRTHRVPIKNVPGPKLVSVVVTKKTLNPVPGAKVYCFTEPKRHRGVFNGVLTAQCGEQPLLPWESCNLGSINLSKFVEGKGFDYDKLGHTIDISVRFLDNIIDVNKYPKVRIAHKTKLTRKIGLGVMGWADSLLMMGIRYDTKEAFDMAAQVMKFIQSRSHKASGLIAKEKGVFPAAKRMKLRNATTTTIAPTGTISIIAGCSSGIEPIFSKNYTKTALDGKKLDMTSPYADSPALVTAHEIHPKHHIQMQAIFQKYTDNAVSKTINLREDSKVEDVMDILFQAHNLGCKGFTVYREGSRDAPLQITTEGVNGLSECQTGRCAI